MTLHEVLQRLRDLARHVEVELGLVHDTVTAHANALPAPPPPVPVAPVATPVIDTHASTEGVATVTTSPATAVSEGVAGISLGMLLYIRGLTQAARDEWFHELFGLVRSPDGTGNGFADPLAVADETGHIPFIPLTPDGFTLASALLEQSNAGARVGPVTNIETQ